MNVERFQHDFMNRVHNPWQFTGLLDHLPDLCFFLKTRDSQFVMANNQFLKLLGLSHVQDAISKTDLDFFKYELAHQYIEDDRLVVDGKHTVPNRLWLIPNLKQGTVSSFRCTKMPVYSDEGIVIGLAGILRFVTGNDANAIPCDKMTRAVDFMSKNYQRRVTLEELAAMVHMSVRQFARRFWQVLHVSPVQYLIKVRIGAACRLLRNTNRILTDIALDVGFCDHCYFCRQFKKCIGVTPKQYRETQGLAVT